MVQSTNIASSYQFLLFLAHAGKTQLSFLSAAKYKLANQKTYNPLRNPPSHKTPRQLLWLFGSFLLFILIVVQVTGRLTDWLIDQLIDWLNDRLIDWLI